MKKLIPPVLMLVGLILMILLHRYWPIAAFGVPPWTWLGAIPIIAGVALAVAGFRGLRKAGTTVNPLGQPTNLVTGGVYKYSRNPIYLGLTLILAGAWLIMGTVSGIAAVILFVVAVDRLHIRREESVLKEKFGREFEEYCSRTGRWL